MARRKGDFSSKVIEALIKEVNGHCARCDKYTFAGKVGKPGKTYTIGKAAHICAASGRGPRYEASMTHAERVSSDNGIWLCGPCSDEIDADKDQFPPQALRDMKRLAVDRQRKRINTRPYREEDAVTMVRQLLNIKGHQPLPLSGAVHDLIHTEDRAIERLDPRLTAESEFRNGQRYIHLSAAAEPVDIRMTFDGDHARVYQALHQRLNDHGTPMTLPLDVLKLSGSPLFDQLISMPGGTLTIGPVTRSARNTFELHHPTSGEVRRYEDFVGQLQYGNLSASFDGVACDGVFQFAYECHAGPPATFPRVQLTIQTELWEGRPITHLPYLDWALEIAGLIADGWRFHTELRVEGKRAFSGDVNFNAEQKAFFKESHQFLTYTQLCQQVAKKRNVQVPFTATVTYTLGQLDEMRTSLRLFDGEKVECGFHNALETIEYLVPTDPKVLAQSARADRTPDAVVIKKRGAALTLFGINVPLPDYYVELTSARVRYAVSAENAQFMRVHATIDREPDCRCFAYNESRHLPPHLFSAGDLPHHES